MGVFRDMFLRLSTLSPVRYTASKCGHRTRLSGRVSVFGAAVTTTMPKQEDGLPEYCLDCISKMAIRCAWCKDPIFIGDPITLYTPTNPDFEVHEHAVVYNKDPLQVVGCLGWNCADTGADRAGFWLPGNDGKGSVSRVPTVFEMILGAEEPSAVIVSDTHDIHEALNPKIVPLKDSR